MKKIIKRITAFIICATIISSFMVTASAIKIGDVMGYAQPTNIIASVNGYQMMSYNVNGYTYVIAEDLRHYGFDVAYDDSTRSLTISRNAQVDIAPHITLGSFWNIGSNKEKKNILHTDIGTYIAGEFITSYNINGSTIVCFDELAKFGQVSYDNERREISLTVSGIKKNPVAELVDLIHEEGIASEFKVASEMSAKNAYGSRVSCEGFIRAKGNVLVFEGHLNGIVLTQKQRQREQQSMDSNMYSLRNGLYGMKDMVPGLDAVACVLYDGSGKVVATKTVPFN